MNQENHITYYHYGLNSKRQAQNLALRVCRVLTTGFAFPATHLLLETACAETALGTYPDPTPNGAGHGLCQFDSVGFEDVKQRIRPKHKTLVAIELGYNIDQCVITDLDTDPLLSFIFCRVKYMLDPLPIPTDIKERAYYWKRLYNTTAGKGSIEHYLEASRVHLYNGALPLNSPLTTANKSS